MRTSLNETAYIEEHLLGTMLPEEDLVCQARLLLDERLADNVYWQRQTYNVIRAYGRRNLKQEILEIHSKLFEQPEHRSFRESILSLFRRR